MRRKMLLTASTIGVALCGLISGLILDSRPVTAGDFSCGDFIQNPADLPDAVGCETWPQN
jgi:hypothetical protein